jgi:hypothetical protein
MKSITSPTGCNCTEIQCPGSTSWIEYVCGDVSQIWSSRLLTNQVDLDAAACAKTKAFMNYSTCDKTGWPPWLVATFVILGAIVAILGAIAAHQKQKPSERI